MRRIAAVALGAVVGLLGADRLRAGDERLAVEPSMAPPSTVPAGGQTFGSPLPGSSTDRVVDDGALASIARRWVTAMWTRPPGDAPLAWLDRVADITAPDLDAELRTARPWLGDGEVISSTVEVAGVYPDARDRARLTVTCVAHHVTTAGGRDEPCATTVTIASGARGRLLVVEVR
ncbi:MAG: hypothetical protein M3P85_04860 [Actinomycetota bacterium]|nr:hypothetical protein [Actinomycetota bacterium]